MHRGFTTLTIPIDTTSIKAHLLASKTSILWGKMPELPKQKIKNMSIFLASWLYLMVIIDNSSFLVIKHCTINVLQGNSAMLSRDKVQF